MSPCPPGTNRMFARVSDPFSSPFSPISLDQEGDTILGDYFWSCLPDRISKSQKRVSCMEPSNREGGPKHPKRVQRVSSLCPFADSLFCLISDSLRVREGLRASWATTKGQNRFGTLSHFHTFPNFFHTSSEFFPQDFFS